MGQSGPASSSCRGVRGKEESACTPSHGVARARPGRSPWAQRLSICFTSGISTCLGFSSPHHRQGDLPILAFRLGIWPGHDMPGACSTSPPPPHDREGISFEALTGNCPPAPHQLVAAGDSSLVSFPSLGMKFFKNQKSKPPPTLVLHGTNPGKAGG